MPPSANMVFRRKPVLWIGLPLWSILTPEERIGVLAHEAAHGTNGRSDEIHSYRQHPDHLGGVVVLHAAQLHQGPYELEGDPTLATFGEIITRALFWIFSLIVEGLIVLLLHLIWRNNQTAEYPRRLT